MSNVSFSYSNSTVGLQYQTVLERAILSCVCTVPACVFLFINGTMLFTLRSKPVFRETCRYVLLYNLLLADTTQLVLTQVLFLLAICRVRLTYPVCGTLTTLANLTAGISPLTLVVMSLERYVAVCYPLRHAMIVTIRNTALAIIASWAVSSLNNFTRGLFLLQFSLESLGTSLMNDYCTDIAWFPDSLRETYDKAYTVFLSVTAGLAVISSYTGVVLAARSASTDKVSALKARKTLLLHLVQLGLSLSSTIYYPLLLALARTVTRIVFVWVQNVFYVIIIILPRCLTSLIYGVRDQTIRPVLLYHLCGRRKLSVEPGPG
ncbi:odorant receptor 131-2-like [Kryptolebias marmoratus]|uniref:Olfactory receptor 2AK2-like n=1 Tax=Kryptolebias marmoratus TaxID=37003 RepID=A0A3Q3AKH6_KRYMA|nr:odorant receptor 131-2-like [Kryptolebias marmoratus]